MSGIYLHIPFCKKACIYCDFHFSTQMKSKNEMIHAISNELIQRKSYIEGPIETIYFGGGTPSVMNEAELELLLTTIHSNFDVVPNAEITFEANPDDLEESKLQFWKKLGINRLSIGIQSFIEENLKWMNRSHQVHQNKSSIQKAQEFGFNNINIDLIYGIPGLTMEQWNNNLQQAIDLDVQHVSCYGLTVEEGTALHHQVQKNMITPEKDDRMAEQFDLLINVLEQNRFIHYEISNFSKEDSNSKHNSSYWKQKHYLGVGPSAHSFNGTSRQWNIANNPLYLKHLKNNTCHFEKEVLSKDTAYNEYILTGLRTIWGVDISTIRQLFGEKHVQHFVEQVKHQKDSFFCIENNKYVLSKEGKFLADRIAMELFID